MAVPASPTRMTLQQGQGQVLVSWQASSGATSYTVQRSTDNATWSTVGSPAVPSYLDTTGTLGTLYYYQVASVNGSGTSGYTASQSIVPAPAGAMSLLQVRLEAQRRADLVNSNYIPQAEWNSYISQSYFELYDLLVTTFEDYYIAPAAIFTADGTSTQYALPTGSNTFTNTSGATFTPQAFYKLVGLDLGVNPNGNVWTTVYQFNFMDRNRYVYPATTNPITAQGDMRYRIMGSNIVFNQPPQGGSQFRLFYVPRLTQPLQDTDLLDGVSGWLEYVIVDAAIKAAQKEETDVTVLLAQKSALIQRIQGSASNRNIAEPSTITDARRGRGGFGNPFGGEPGAGW